MRPFVTILRSTWPAAFLLGGLAMHIASIACLWRGFGPGWGVLSCFLPILNTIAAATLCPCGAGPVVLCFAITWVVLAALGVGLFQFGGPPSKTPPPTPAEGREPDASVDSVRGEHLPAPDRAAYRAPALLRSRLAHD